MIAVSIHELVMGLVTERGLVQTRRPALTAFTREARRIRHAPAEKSGTSGALTARASQGALLIVEPCDADHVDGHPTVPVVRWGYHPELAKAFSDDWNGLGGNRTADEWVD
jgi:hypothetical protein